MADRKNQIIVVTGATGMQGRAVVRHLLAKRFRVRALTRNPASKSAQVLARLGVEVVQGNMNDPASLLPVFAQAYGVFSVQNPMISGIAGEISQGKNVAEVARQVGIQHVVYSSAGLGNTQTGVPSWESKIVVEQYLRSLQLPLTIFRPMAFMELMTEKKFFPAISTWQIMPKLMGSRREVGWISASDYGCIVAKAFAEPERFMGQELSVASDIKSLAECRAIYREVKGKNPFRFPLPVWMFERFGFVGEDLTCMWRWLQTHTFPMSTESTLAIHPEAMRIPVWLKQQP